VISGSISGDEFERVQSAIASASPKTPVTPDANASDWGEGEKDPIAFGINPDFSIAKQQYFEKHEGLKVREDVSEEELGWWM
jgi:hypothetical protein